MTDDDKKKKDEEVDPGVIKIPTRIDGSIKDDLIYVNSDHIGLATQAGILGASTIGENLLEMKINTIGDARNFLVGVNNVASVFSANSGLLHAMESASTLASKQARLTADIIERANIPSITKGIELATAHYLDGNQIVKLSESVTTVLAYGQAVQNQFSTVISNDEMFRGALTQVRDDSVTLGKPLEYIPVYTGDEAITSPFIFEPQEIKTKEVEKALPEVKKELAEKTTEAIEMLEYFQKPDAKKGNKQIITTLNEVKRAMETMLGFTAMFAQKTTTEIAITSIPELQVRNIEESSLSKYRFPRKLPSGTRWENFTIAFLDNKHVSIKVKQLKHSASYKDMGFIGRGKDNPSEAWTFLRVLAQVGGELTIKDPEATDKYKKQKEFLTTILQNYFILEYDPFYPYEEFIKNRKQRNSYKIKMTLIPLPQTDGNKYEPEEDKDDLGLREYFNEQAPEIDDSETRF